MTPHDQGLWPASPEEMPDTEPLEEDYADGCWEADDGAAGVGGGTVNEMRPGWEVGDFMFRFSGNYTRPLFQLLPDWTPGGALPFWCHRCDVMWEDRFPGQEREPCWCCGRMTWHEATPGEAKMREQIRKEFYAW